MDTAYRRAAGDLPTNQAVRIEPTHGRQQLVLSGVDKLAERPSLVALKTLVAQRFPRVELPELLLEVQAWTGFASNFAHVNEQRAGRRPADQRKLGPARAAAAHLLRAEAGLSVQQVAPLLARSPQTICEFSRNARLADQTSMIAELINRARQLLDASMHSSAAQRPSPCRNVVR